MPTKNCPTGSLVSARACDEEIDIKLSREDCRDKGTECISFSEIVLNDAVLNLGGDSAGIELPESLAGRTASGIKSDRFGCEAMSIL